MNPASYTSMDDALDLLSACGPDLRNGLTSHAPMASEALCAMGRPDAVLPWLEVYRRGMLPRPAARERITHANWRSALAQEQRTSDWSEFFAEELRERPWREVLSCWTARFAPAVCASAAHGVIRVGHAVRSLGNAESPLRLRELADALGYWAATYQELPTARAVAVRPMPAREAIRQVTVQPPAQRVFMGTIVSSLQGLDAFPDFAAVIGLIDVEGDPVQRGRDLAEVFAHVYLANVHDVLTSIVFIHGVTSVGAAVSILPFVDERTAQEVLRYTWQAGCGLYAAFGDRPAPDDLVETPPADAESLIDAAVAHGDEHAIKFTEACLRFHAIKPSPVFLAAARNALEVLPRS